MHELGRVAVGLRDWTLAEEAGRLLVDTGAGAGEGHFFVARAQLSQRELQSATASLSDAVAAGYTDAAYYLAPIFQNNPARARETLDGLSSDSFFAPFALAWRLAYGKDLESEERNEISEAFDASLESGFEIRDFHSLTEHLSIRPMGMSLNHDYFQSGGRFPVAIAWTVPAVPTEADPTAVVIAAEPDEGIIVRRGLWRLQMQWVENEVPWRLLERAKSESERPPGWIDTARDWYGLRENSAVSVQRDSGNACLRATNDNVDTFGWVYSAPANVEATTSYIAAGRVKSIDAKASLAWQGLSENERVEFDTRLADEVDSPDWTWYAGYAPSFGLWTTARLSLGVTRHVGSAAFDDLLLVKIAPLPSSLHPLPARRVQCGGAIQRRR